MASFNRVTLVGNLTREIDLKFTQNETAVADIGMAVNERRKDSSGGWVDDPVFVDVTLWGKTAETAAEYLGKGSLVLIDGRLKLDTWEHEGQRRSKLRVVADRMQMLGTPKGAKASSRQETAAAAASSEDIPF